VPRPVCFTCGLPVSGPLRLNRMENGQICPTCRDRLLEALPPILPKRRRGAPQQREDAGSAVEDPGEPPIAS